MWRTLLCVGLFVAFVGVVNAEDKNKAKFMKAQIVKVNPETNTVTIRTGTGTEAKEQELRVSATTKFYGSDKQPLTDGLKFKGFKEGTDVWYQMGAGADKDVIADLRLYDPALPGGIK